MRFYRPSIYIGSKLGRRRASNAIDLIGKRFGMLVCVVSVGVDKRQSRLWSCRCDCGGTTIASTGNLRSGNSKSCGCRRSEAHNQATEKQRQRSQDGLQQRLSLIAYPASISDIAIAIFSGDTVRAAQWASENTKSGWLYRSSRGIYCRRDVRDVSSESSDV